MAPGLIVAHVPKATFELLQEISDAGWTLWNQGPHFAVWDNTGLAQSGNEARIAEGVLLLDRVLEDADNCLLAMRIFTMAEAGQLDLGAQQ